ncbi:TetR/AcrR family transcriptional regulator [Sphaerisporangium corydalis]|uniref:TetR/AcrR family transcriptional regulator n=1 Tax=Sphaerisporangium corydalis TaxID=1441875 RepID=A0ABV9EKA1_9ACTN|nr:TetR/AcrR family transcriptional regulator [Sphaerisporangium corydalis]
MRADARRNRDQVIAAATAVIAEEGPDASLNEIARRAGVGPGTLYRHFPTRRELIAAVFRERVETLCAGADRLAAASPPGEALTAWMRAMLKHVLTDRGLATAMMDIGPVAGFDCHALLRSTAGRLLTAAQAAGAVRPDLQVEELFQLITGIAHATPDLPHATRLLSLTLEGLHAPH